jgi:flagellar hook-basal body complex protein FliE
MNEISVFRNTSPASAFQPQASGKASAEGGFLGALSSAVEAVNGIHADATSKVAGMLSGDGEDIHSAMIAVESADLAFQLVMQVRNKVVNAYQEVAHMQF